MILNIKDKKIQQIYSTYFNSLSVDYQENSDKFILENTIKCSKILPIPYSICYIFCDQIIYFLQLLKQHNLSIIDFSPIYFEIGYTSPKNIQFGGSNEKRIENKLMNVDFHGDETMYLESNIQKPFIVMKNIELIIPIHPENNNFDIQYNMLPKFKNTIEQNQKYYSNFKFYHNSILAKINKKEFDTIHIKESYLSLALFLFHMLLLPEKEINSLRDFQKQLKTYIFNTPLFYCIERILKPSSSDRFLFII